MQAFSADSIDMGKIACFYLFDLTDYLRKSSLLLQDKSILKKENGEVEQAILFIGGWSKTTYLTEINVFYPRLN